MPMNAGDLQERLNITEEKVKKLLKTISDQRNQIAHLEKENAQIKVRLEEKKQQADSFQKTTEIAKIANYLADDGSNPSELKEKLDEYIKGIDQCITFINRQL